MAQFTPVKDPSADNPERLIEDEARQLLIEDLQRHTPEGLEAPPEARRLSMWIVIPLAIVAMTVLCAAVYSFGGWEGVIVAFILLPMFYFLASSPLWITALLRAKEHKEIEEEADQVLHDDEPTRHPSPH